MNPTIKVSTIRGAGLTFPVAALLFLLFGNLYVIALIPAGALLGLGIGMYLIHHPGAIHKPGPEASTTIQKTAQPGWLMSRLCHPNLMVRTASLAALGAGLMLISWYIGYYLLPEGVFRAGAEAQMQRAALDNQSASVVEEWSKIFFANLLPAAMILLGSLLMRINGLPFGYLVALYNTIGYGLFLGTNSFAISMPARVAPSFAVLERSGAYEMFALLLLAAATYTWSLFEIKQLFRTNPIRVQDHRISGLEILLVAVGIGILAAANWREAAMVMALTVQ